MLPLTTVVTRSMTRNAPRSVRNLNYSIQHDAASNTFTLQLNTNHSGTVEYVKKGNVLVLNHSYIPDILRGHGYGNTLAQKTFDYIVAKNYKMSITCPFLLKCYKENEGKYKKYYVD